MGPLEYAFSNVSQLRRNESSEEDETSLAEASRPAPPKPRQSKPARPAEASPKQSKRACPPKPCRSKRARLRQGFGEAGLC